MQKKSRSVTSDILAALSWGLIAGLIYDFISGVPNDPYGFGHWHLNPLYDLVFLRIGGPFLYGNHVSVGLGIISIPIFYCIKRKSYSAVPIWLSAAFGIVFLHEITLEIFSDFVYGWQLVYFQLLSYYMFALAAFFVLALVFGGSFIRQRLFYTFLITASANGIVELFYGIFNYRPLTLAQFAPGPQVNSLVPNVIELILWFLPIAVWLYPEQERYFFWHLQIKELHPHNYLRYLLFSRRRKYPLALTPNAKLLMSKEYSSWEDNYVPKDGLKGKIVLDVGAGCGETAYFFLRQGASSVICIEPDEKKFQMLCENIDKLKWFPRVRAFKDKFSIADFELLPIIDYAKIDCEGGERLMLKMEFPPKFPFSVEIHSKRLAQDFKDKFPGIQIKKQYILFSTWLGRYEPNSS